MQFLHFSREGHLFLRFGASWSPMAAWSPRCLPDASQMPLRCFSSWWFLLYDSLFNASSSRISSLSSLLQRVPLHDSSWLISLPWFFEWVYKETLFGVSRWGHLCISLCQSLLKHMSYPILDHAEMFIFAETVSDFYALACAGAYSKGMSYTISDHTEQLILAEAVFNFYALACAAAYSTVWVIPSQSTQKNWY